MKQFLSVVAAILLLAGMTGVSQAALTTIGTATYDDGSGPGPANYNLIYDADSPFGPITWLDYRNSLQSWDNQVSWVAGLGASLIVTLNPGYTTSVDWTTGWRLPSTIDGIWIWGYDGTTMAGYNITSSEMGHLYYEELGNLGRYDTDGNEQSGFGLNNTGDFNNLIASWYWSGTEYANNTDDAWFFYTHYGHQASNPKINTAFGLAVRSGQISTVPLPTAVWLLASGLAGLAALGKGRKGNRV